VIKEKFNIANNVANKLESLYKLDRWYGGISVDYGEETQDFYIRLRVISDGSPKYLEPINNIKIVFEKTEIPKVS
jgi:hypothetical protein